MLSHVRQNTTAIKILISPRIHSFPSTSKESFATYISIIHTSTSSRSTFIKSRCNSPRPLSSASLASPPSFSQLLLPKPLPCLLLATFLPISLTHHLLRGKAALPKISFARGCDGVSPSATLLFETSPLTSSVRGVKSSFCIWICPSTARVCWATMAPVSSTRSGSSEIRFVGKWN